MAYASRCLSLERIPRSLAFPGGAGAFLCLPCGGRSVRCLRRGAGRVAGLPLAARVLPVHRCASRSKPHLVSLGLLPGDSFRVVQRSPLRRRHRWSPLPAVRVRTSLSAPALPSARCCQAASLVPPTWFLTTATASSSRDLWACCIPLPTLGFIGFQRGVRGPLDIHASSPMPPALQSFPHPQRRTRRHRPAVAILPFSGSAQRDAGPVRLHGVAPCERPLPPLTFPPANARCSPGLPYLEPRACSGGYRRCRVAPPDVDRLLRPRAAFLSARADAPASSCLLPAPFRIAPCRDPRRASV